MRWAPAGYTLLELLVVLVVIALLSGLAISVFPGRSDVVELEAAARRVADLAAEARSQAQLRGAPVELSAAAPGAITLLPQGTTLELARGSSATAVGLVAPMIRFFPDGSSSGGVVAINRGPWRATIEIGWFDGAASVAGASRAS